MEAIGDVLLFSLTVAVMLVGMAAIIIPQVPSVLIIWLAALGYSVQAGFTAPGPLMFVAISIFGLAGATADIWMKLLGAKVGGASLLGMLAGAVLGLIGMIIFFPLGGIIGSVAGVALVEYLRTGSLRAALHTGGGTFGGFVLTAVAELVFGLITIGLFVASVLVPLPF